MVLRSVKRPEAFTDEKADSAAERSLERVPGCVFEYAIGVFMVVELETHIVAGEFLILVCSWLPKNSEFELLGGF
jgi:hypothetical protein